MAEQALDDLLSIMRDQRVGMRDRINASISASRVSSLTLPGESEPEAVVFLRWIIDFDGGQKGERFSPSFRREAAAALSFWQRRAAKMALTYEVPDQTERAAGWRRVINGALRACHPQHKAVLLGPSDTFELPLGDPERTMAALFLPISGTSARRRQRAVDDPGGVRSIVTEAERLALLKPLANIVEARLKAFGLEQSMERQTVVSPTAAETLASRAI